MDFAVTEAQEELQGLARQILDDRMSLAHLKGATSPTSGTTATRGASSPRRTCSVSHSRRRTADLASAFSTCASCCARSAARSHRSRRSRHWSPGRCRSRVSAPSRSRPSCRSWCPATCSSHAGSVDRAGRQPTTRRRDGDGWRFDGVEVERPGRAPRRNGARPRVDRRRGREHPPLLPTNTAGAASTARQADDEPRAPLRAAPRRVQVGHDARLGAPEQGREILEWTLNRLVVGSCAVVAGVAGRGPADHRQYTIDRKQFDRQIGTFQAVGQRMADCYIDNQAIELTMCKRPRTSTRAAMTRSSRHREVLGG